MSGKKKVKLTRRMKRTIKLSIATLCLLSAGIIALVPGTVTQAGVTKPEVELTSAESSIPNVTASDMIYTTGDGQFQFCYVNKVSSENKVAVLVGFDYERALENGDLEIPETVDAYKKYTQTQGSIGGYTAVGKSGNALFYPIYGNIEKEKKDPQTGLTVIDPVTGQPEMETVVGITGYAPCYYNDYDKWFYNVLDDGTKDIDPTTKSQRVRPANNYYYDKNEGVSGATPNYEATTAEAYQRITNATVAYISSKHVEQKLNLTTHEFEGWELKDPDATNPVGIFTNATNIKNLTISKELLGIGDYAFYGCTSLKSIKLANGIGTIGNHAFENCTSMDTVKLPAESRIQALGACTFKGCTHITDMTIPTGVKKIGDQCFAGCTRLENVVFGDGVDNDGSGLNLIGNDVFVGDSSLTKIVFPDSFKNSVDISWFEGCTGLEHLTFPNPLAEVKEEDSTFGYEEFAQMVTDEFYFEGSTDPSCKLHIMTKDEGFAFKYYGQEIYEKVVTAEKTPSKKQLVYRVNNNNELIYFYMDSGIANVDIPAKIGPYGVATITDTCFKDNRTIEKITIPSTITRIEDDAFKGCCNLADVIFTEPINLNHIGNGAFDTQVTDGPNPITNPQLTFTGVASYNSMPYAYAMNSNSNINRGSQPLTYITFYTGWPSNQTIVYNPDTQMSELVNVPRVNNLSNLGSLNLPYMTDDMINAATVAASKLNTSDYTFVDGTTDDEKDILNAAINIEIPEGVQSIKEGLFSNRKADGSEVNPGGSSNGDLVTITTDNLTKIDPYAFYGMPRLLGAYINGDTSEIGDHAFGDCLKLADVDINSKLKTMGTGVFHYDENVYGSSTKDKYDQLKGDLKTDIEFGDDADFVCDKGIIFGTNSKGDKVSVKEVLMNRGYADPVTHEIYFGSGAISSSELEGVMSVDPEAFKSCESILSVDFSKAELTEVPEKCFEYTKELNQVNLNEGTRRVGSQAFKDSGLRVLDIPASVAVIDNNAFEGATKSITFYTPDDSPAAYYAESNPLITAVDKPITYIVQYFFDKACTQLIHTEELISGSNGNITFTPDWLNDAQKAEISGKSFKNWSKQDDLESVTMGIRTYAVFSSQTWKVIFKMPEGDVYKERTVNDGETVEEPKSPVVEGKEFVKWIGFSESEPIHDNMIFYAEFKDPGSNGGNGNNNNNSSSPSPSGSGNKNGNNGSGSSPAPTKTFNLLVTGGSGSGSYVPGTSVVVQAQAPSGYVFDKWTCEDTSVQFLSATIPTTIVTMPSKDMIITANFKAASNSGSGNGNSNNNKSSSSTTPSTKVNISKTGFSNTDIASAKVSGSSDNFVLKITDDPNAKAAVEDALLNKYDSLENIKYLAMDISLYDETGKNKITNTKDIKLSVTIPLPDDLLPYAGNNMVGVVENGKMVDVAAKYTTINNVPCVTFNPPHLSPYAIYVDTQNLSASSFYDETPKTGDGLAPKWFLCFGLIGISVFFYVLSIDKKKVTLTK